MKIMQEWRDITTVIYMYSIREYYDQLDAKKLDNWEEMYTFLAICKLLTLTQEEFENLNIPKTNEKIELLIKIFTQKNTQN